MTPAERLLAAAELLDKRAGEATQGEQFADEVMLMGVRGTHDADAAYIATMRPEVGKAQAAWLRAEANRVLNGPVVFGGEKALFTASPEAVALADLLLAGGS